MDCLKLFDFESFEWLVDRLRLFETKSDCELKNNAGFDFISPRDFVLAFRRSVKLGKPISDN